MRIGGCTSVRVDLEVDGDEEVVCVYVLWEGWWWCTDNDVTILNDNGDDDDGEWWVCDKHMRENGVNGMRWGRGMCSVQCRRAYDALLSRRKKKEKPRRCKKSEKVTETKKKFKGKRKEKNNTRPTTAHNKTSALTYCKHNKRPSTTNNQPTNHPTDQQNQNQVLRDESKSNRVRILHFRPESRPTETTPEHLSAG